MGKSFPNTSPLATPFCTAFPRDLGKWGGLFQNFIFSKIAQLTFNTAQYELINLLSCVNKEDDLAELKNVIVQFLNTRMQREIDKLWDAGVINDEQIEQWGKEHMRTPYKQA